MFWRRQPSLETSLAMAEVQLACLLVDYRDRPEILRELHKQRDALMALRRRQSQPQSAVARLRAWLAGALGRVPSGTMTASRPASPALVLGAATGSLRR